MRWVESGENAQVSFWLDEGYLADTKVCATRHSYVSNGGSEHTSLRQWYN